MMSKAKTAALCFLLLAATTAHADDQAELRALIDKGIKSAGGHEKLSAFKAATCKITGKSLVGDQKVFSCTASLQGMDQLKLEGTLERGGVSKSFALVLNGTEAWSQFDGKVDTADKDDVLAVKDISRAFYLARGLIPLKGKDLTLSPLGEIDVNGKAAVGLKVSARGRKDIHLFLDKTSGLPVRTELRVPKQEGGESTLAFTLSDYRETAGPKHFSKLAAGLDGKLAVEAEVSEIQWLEKLDPAVFARP